MPDQSSAWTVRLEIFPRTSRLDCLLYSWGLCSAHNLIQSWPKLDSYHPLVHLWVMPRADFSAQDSISDMLGIIHRHSLKWVSAPRTNWLLLCPCTQLSDSTETPPSTPRSSRVLLWQNWLDIIMCCCPSSFEFNFGLDCWTLWADEFSLDQTSHAL